MNKTGISWTDLTWNPVSGCSKVSEGCLHCYAEAWSKRFHRPFQVIEHPERLPQIFKIPSGKKVFVNSMSDLFHEQVSDMFRREIFALMRIRGDVIFQVLTKRAENMKKFSDIYIVNPPKNVWLGVSVENKNHLNRIDILRETHAFLKFVSFEPLLEDIGRIDLSGIDWVIIGGESGPHYRKMDIEWARNIVIQAKKQGIALWMKQLGGIRPGGDIEDFPEDLRIREFPRGYNE